MNRGWIQLKLGVLCCVVVATLAAACHTNAAMLPSSPMAVPAAQPAAANAAVELWVDPVQGDDHNSGATADDALATISAAWEQIPSDEPLHDQGYRIQLLPGDYSDSTFPVYWEQRHGTESASIEIRAANGPGTARLHGNLNFFAVDFLSLIDLNVENAGDVFHCEQCQHFTLQGLHLDGGNRQAHETVKINQSQYITITHNEIFGSYENVIDFVAVQYGVISDNRLHDADDWCMYLKGGSAYFRIERNVIYNCGTGGFTAGQGTGFEFMSAPWLQYEAYDIKFVNNIVHDTEGAGFGVNGGYNILFAYNTLYRVGARSHLVEVVFGGRTCDGNSAACSERLTQGGWGTAQQDEEPIPDRNIYIYNNLIYNPPGYQSQWQHFAIYGPRTPGAASNIPDPAVTDENLQIRGNWIWNGPADHPLGIGEGEGCAESNPTCNQAQLIADNSVNQSPPAFVDATTENFQLSNGADALAPVTIPVFAGWTPPVPSGTLANEVTQDFGNQARTGKDLPGALVNGTTPEEPELSYSIYLPGLAN
jgi:hypothetical protein